MSAEGWEGREIEHPGKKAEEISGFRKLDSETALGRTPKFKVTFPTRSGRKYAGSIPVTAPKSCWAQS